MIELENVERIVEEVAGEQITGIVIGRNQGLTLDACLASLAGVDKLIYVDLGSNDGSVSIARHYNARIVRGDAEVGGAGLRNAASRLCGTTWAIWLSPDDVLQAGAMARIKREIQTCPDDGIGLKMLESKFPGHQFYFPRVFRTSCKWVGRCHEYFEGSVKTLLDASITHTRGPWHDNPTDPMGVRNALAIDLAQDPKNPRWLYFYAREFFDHGDYAQAVVWFERRVAIVGSLPERADAWLYLARCYWHLKRDDDARAACAAALTINSNFREAAMFMVAMVPDRNKKPWEFMAARSDNYGVLVVRPS